MITTKQQPQAQIINPYQNEKFLEEAFIRLMRDKESRSKSCRKKRRTNQGLGSVLRRGVFAEEMRKRENLR
jgi:hypothetical protein